MIRALSLPAREDPMKQYLLTFLVAACAVCIHIVVPAGISW